MSWDSIFAALLLLGCVSFGMILGAWITTRGFEKSMTTMMDNPESPWNKDD
tara:strand:+ start:1407 stop:1559 length:153 start_codon:yes stop_codon:yes gene_type:complete